MLPELKAFPTIGLILLALCTLFLTSILHAKADGNLLQNPGFEERTAVWESYGGTFGCTEDPVRSGSLAGVVTAPGAGMASCIYQTHSACPGDTCSLSGWVLGDGPSDAEVLLRLSWYEMPGGYGGQLRVDDSGTVRLGAPGVYRFLTTGEVVAPEGACSVRVMVVIESCGPANAVVCADDFSFVRVEAAATPSPSPTPAPTAQPSPSPTPTPAPSATSTPGPTASPSSTPIPTPVSTPQRSEGVVINEVQYNPDGTDSAYEWIELYNLNTCSVEVTGWSVEDNQEMDSIPDLRLGPGGYAVVAAGAGFHYLFPGFKGSIVYINDGSIGNGLSNSGDRLMLVDSAGSIVDAMSYGADAGVLSPPCVGVPEGHSLERWPAGIDTGRASDFVDNGDPTPGTGLSALPSTPSPAPSSTPAFTPAPAPTVAPTPPPQSALPTLSPPDSAAPPPLYDSGAPAAPPQAGVELVPRPADGAENGSHVYVGLYSFLSMVGVGLLAALVWFKVRGS